jgi:hypothetical protein
MLSQRGLSIAAEETCAVLFSKEYGSATIEWTLSTS